MSTRELWDELQAALDPDRRQEIGYRMQEIVHEEAPWIFLHIQPDVYGVSEPDRLAAETRRNYSFVGRISDSLTMSPC